MKNKIIYLLFSYSILLIACSNDNDCILINLNEECLSCSVESSELNNSIFTLSPLVDLHGDSISKSALMISSNPSDHDIIINTYTHTPFVQIDVQLSSPVWKKMYYGSAFSPFPSSIMVKPVVISNGKFLLDFELTHFSCHCSGHVLTISNAYNYYKTISPADKQPLKFQEMIPLDPSGFTNLTIYFSSNYPRK